MCLRILVSYAISEWKQKYWVAVSYVAISNTAFQRLVAILWALKDKSPKGNCEMAEYLAAEPHAISIEVE